MAALEYWLWLSAAEISARSKELLVRQFGDAEHIFFAPDGEIGRVPGITANEAKKLENRDLNRAKQIELSCREQNLLPITIQDAAYPRRLQHIYAPPVVLYVKGRLPAVDENALISVIGTRKASYYGIKMGKELAWQISKSGGIVVSLLTNGVDAAAAKGALLAGNPCIGVLGTPHECESSELSKDVAAYGALISEYPPGMEPKRSFFRERNRVAAGLSVGVVVVEAPEKSGTRLFANEAAEQGKEIFAVPGNADAENSAGALALLKEGAKLVTNGWDVLSEFEALFLDKLHPYNGECPQTAEDTKDQTEAPQADKKAVDKPDGKRYIDLKEQLADLSEEQLKIISAIERNASHVDDIIETTGLPTAKVLAQLTLLEIKGYVRREAGRRIALNIAKK